MFQSYIFEKKNKIHRIVKNGSVFFLRHYCINFV